MSNKWSDMYLIQVSGKLLLLLLFCIIKNEYTLMSIALEWKKIKWKEIDLITGTMLHLERASELLYQKKNNFKVLLNLALIV